MFIAWNRYAMKLVYFYYWNFVFRCYPFLYGYFCYVYLQFLLLELCFSLLSMSLWIVLLCLLLRTSIYERGNKNSC
jgi:hypothetical protein